MTKTKQQKFTNSLKQTQLNTFSDGLNMDLHPMSTPNTILTDCVNGTMITYNDNEFALQNERGNIAIKNGDVPVELKSGFIPVAMKEYNGILYIVSYNPMDKKTEIGTFPSPKKNMYGNELEFRDNLIDKNFVSNYSSYSKDVIKYDYNLSVSNYDKYLLQITRESNPLLVLDHYVLDKQGNFSKIKLKSSEKFSRFTHVGEGVLGYLYRPFYVSSVTSSINPVKGAKTSQLVITTTSDDEELWQDKPEVNSDGKYEKKWTDLSVVHEVDVVLLTDNDESLNVNIKDLDLNESDSLSVIVNNWDYTYNITSTDVINLNFKREFTINNQNYKYDFRERSIVLMDGNTPTNTNYKKIKFHVRTKLTSKVNPEFTIYMDNLDHDVIANVSDVFTQESWFSKFQYCLSDGCTVETDDIMLDFNIVLDLTKYDIRYDEYKESNKKEAFYKLHEIDENGNLSGVAVSKIKKFIPTHDVSTIDTEIKLHDLLYDSNSKSLFYKSPTNGSFDIVSIPSIKEQECNSLVSEITPRYVQYIKEDEKTYNIVLMDNDYNIISTTNIYENLFNSLCWNEMEEYFDDYTDSITYLAKNIKVKKNKVYLFELDFNIFNISENADKREKASFIVVTADKMLDKKWAMKYDRMDEIQLNGNTDDGWFVANYSFSDVDISDPQYWTPNFIHEYKNNKIHLDQIDSKEIDEVASYAKKFFLKYNSLFSWKDEYMIPTIYQRITSKYSFNNNTEFNCKVQLSGWVDLDIEHSKALVYEDDYDKKYSLEGTAKEYKQTVERKYLWDLFKDSWSETSVKCGDAYNVGGYIHYYAGIEITWDTRGSFIYWPQTKKYYYTSDGDPEYKKNRYDFLKSTKKLTPVTKKFCKKRKGRCADTAGGDEITGYYPGGEKGNIGASLSISGIGNGIYFWNIKNGKYVTYSGNKEKLFLRCKSDNSYYLMGIDQLYDKDTTKIAYDVILKHMYYLNPVNKTVFQYTYNTEEVKDDSGEIEEYQIKIKNESPEIPIIEGRLYPQQCVFIDFDYSSYNIQSYNNLNYHDLKNISKNIYLGNTEIKFENLKDKYIIFLRTLGKCLNDFQITNEMLSQYNNSYIYFDYAQTDFEDDMSYYMFNENEYGTNFFTDFSQKYLTPDLKYDKVENILYTSKIDENQIEQFKYSGDCVGPLKWNYSLTFNQFWPNCSVETVNDLNKYHSLLFYRYSSYADE